MSQKERGYYSPSARVETTKLQIERALVVGICDDGMFPGGNKAEAENNDWQGAFGSVVLRLVLNVVYYYS
jgi:hypothetical protein